MTKKKILIIDNDLRNCLSLRKVLTQNNLDVSIENDGRKGLRRIKAEAFDFCILETQIYLKTGFQIASEIRKENNDMPIFFLSLHASKENILKGFECGADDFIKKPFDNDILLIKIKKILGEKQQRADNGKFEFYFGESYFNSKLRQLTCKNKTVTLTPKENLLLKLLLENLNEFMSKNAALQLIWKRQDFFSGKCMDTYIARLRKHLSTDKTVIIENIRESGYRLLSCTDKEAAVSMQCSQLRAEPAKAGA
ncbi:MAG: response regulator [Flavobacterium sp.]